jgi:hypothetical protein
MLAFGSISSCWIVTIDELTRAREVVNDVPILTRIFNYYSSIILRLET